MKNYFIKKPIIIIGVISIILVSARKCLPILFGKNYEELFCVCETLIKLILLFSTIYIIKKEKLINWDFTHKNIFYSLFISAVIVFLSLQHAFSRINELKISVSAFDHCSYLIQCLSTGFFEEYFFRVLIFGYVCHALNENQKANHYKPILITSFLFSIAHLTNLFNDEMDISSVINQIMFAFVIGVILQSIFFRWNNILLNSVIHGFINYNGMIRSRLFKIEDHSIDVSALENFTQSFITFVIIGLFIALPITYFSVRNRKNYLIRKL